MRELVACDQFDQSRHSPAYKPGYTFKGVSHFELLKLRCERADVVVHVLCALGKPYQELEHFHEHRFFGLCEMTIEYLAQTGLSIESNLADSAPAGSTFSYRLPNG